MPNAPASPAGARLCLAVQLKIAKGLRFRANDYCLLRNPWVNAMVVQSTGSLLIGGSFTHVRGVQSNTVLIKVGS